MRPDVAAALGAGFLSGDWTEDGLLTSGARVIGRRPQWLRQLAAQVLAAYPTAPRDRPRELAAAVAGLPAAAKARRTRVLRRAPAPTAMARNRWALPVLDGLDDLAALLELTPSELDWFADPKRWAREAAVAPLQHYRVGHRVAASGAIRVLEAPKPRLKRVQRLLLDEVLDHVPPHDAARGFRPGGSVARYAAPHAGRATVLHLDLEAFFASVTVGRVYGLWRTAGYPEPVAHLLAGLTTTVLPRAAWRALPRPADPACTTRTGGSAAGSPPRTSPRAHRPHRRWRTSRRTASTSASPPSPPRGAGATPGTPTTSPSRATAAGEPVRRASSPPSPRSCGTRASG